MLAFRAHGGDDANPSTVVAIMEMQMRSAAGSGFDEFSTRTPGRWFQDRELVRAICLVRSHAGFLAARLLTLSEQRGDGDSGESRRASMETASQLRQVIRRYVALLSDLGESPDSVLRLVEELAAGCAAQGTFSAGAVAELHRTMSHVAVEAASRRGVFAPYTAGAPNGNGMVQRAD